MNGNEQPILDRLNPIFLSSTRKPKNTSDCVWGFIKEKFKFNIGIYPQGEFIGS
jgi:hypothetical protein